MMQQLLSGPGVLLEDRLSVSGGGWLYHSPVAVISCDEAGGVDRAFSDIEEALRGGLHVAGLLSYELGYVLEPKLRDRLPAGRRVPLLWFGVFGAPECLAAEEADGFFAELGPPAPIGDVHYGHDAATHAENLRTVLGLIESGDIYQANVTFPISFSCPDPLRLYGALRSRQPVSFGGFARLGEICVASVSPELWLEVEGNRATTRPMKGTSRRGADAREDAALRRALAEDPKQRSENLMIVDLLRNDLSRVCEVGSVRVPSLFEVESYPGFLAMSSTITGVLRSGTTLKERIAALFPCGSIVGAPKIRAAEILRGIEAEPRGFYTGALGAIAPDCDMRFSVAIRSAVIHGDGTGVYGVGGGIVAESRADDEYDEALLKGRVLTGLTEPYDLVETFRWQSRGGYVRLPQHLERLRRSAEKLGFVLDLALIENRLAERDGDGFTDQRVRLVLRRDGSFDVTATPLAPAKAGALLVGVAEARLDPGDPFLRHKTSLRERYETAFSHAAASGLDEAVFLNTRGEIAEASRNSVFVLQDGLLLTPPLSSGVLPGVLRQTLLQSGEAREQPLSRADLEGAAKWFLGNSLHGLREAVFVA